MSITDTQKVDYLWKKVGYGRAKTDVNSVKGATNESISSPLFTRGQNVWSQADLIPGVIPATSAGVVTVYPTTAPVECVPDTTATSNRTWKTQSIDWIPPEVGPTYLIKVYAHTSGQSGSAAASGTTLSAAETNEEAEYLRSSQIQSFVNLRTGKPGKLPTPIENINEHIPATLLSAVNESLSCSATGSPETVYEKFNALISKYKPDEIIISSAIHSQPARLKSYSIVANILTNLSSKSEAA